MDIKKQIPLSLFTTFGIGGPARYLAVVSNEEEAKEALQFALDEGIPFIVLGKGSNALFEDRGFDGLVIINKLNHIMWKEPCVTVSSGYSFSLLGVQSARKALAGLEFASGIPASVGGAIFMNAGANGGQTFDCLKEVVFLQSDLKKLILSKNDLDYNYRFSSFQNMKGMILSAIFELRSDETSRLKQLNIISYRTKTQPYSEKSAGCVFQNPLPKIAGALIDQCGLKGCRCGDAEVSHTHANFIVNKGQARAQDVLQLVEMIQKIVFEKTGEKLSMEMRVIPFGGDSGI